MQGLETELAVKLFERQSRGMSLTGAGHLLYRHAVDNRKKIDDIFSGAREFGLLQRRHVRIATIEGLLASFIASFVADLSRQYPGITIGIRTVGSRRVADMVARHEVDLGFVFGPAPRRDLIELAQIRQSSCVLIAPHHHLADKSSCRMRDLNGLKVILPDPSFGIRQEVDRACAQSKVRLDLCCETNSLPFARTLATQTDLATFLPRHAAMPELIDRTLVAAPLRNTRLAMTRATLVQVVAQQTTPAGRRVAELLVERMAVNDTNDWTSPASSIRSWAPEMPSWGNSDPQLLVISAPLHLDTRKRPPVYRPGIFSLQSSRSGDTNARLQKWQDQKKKRTWNGGRDRDRTCDPYDVNVVLSR